MKQFLFLLFLGQCCILQGQLSFELPRKSIDRSSAEVGVGDFNKDGFADVAICNAEQRWYEGPEFTTWHKIGNSEGGPYAARVADINNDGWDDFITSDGSRTEADVENKDSELYVYLNPGGSGGDPEGLWNRIVIDVNKARHQNDMRIVDMDGDGRLDIIERTWATNERVVIAFQNADINSWTVKTYNTGETGLPEGISAGDVDGDGEMELILSGEYWDNPGGWRSDDNYTRHTIDQEFIQEEVKSTVGDIDGDGDNDVYMGSAERTFRFLAWYENTGLNMDGAVIWTKHMIEDNQGDCHMVDLIDIDKDGDLDICTARSFGSEGMLIYYNDGAGNFTKQDFDPGGMMYTGVVADLDNDGDYDYVGPEKFYGGKKVHYYINNTPGDPPVAPANLALVLLDGKSVRLNWEDLSNNEGTFEIERLTDGAWEPLSVEDSDTEIYTDTETAPGTAYRYRVFAANFAGNSDTITSEFITTWPQVEAVVISPVGGNYTDPPVIVMTTGTQDAEIRYTLDGTEPSLSSPLYSGGFALATSATIAAKAYKALYLPSEWSSETYNIATNGNFLPIADAGGDQQVNGFVPVTLDGTASSDIDDQETLAYLWTQTAGPTVQLVNASSASAGFTPAETGTYIFLLQVSDEAANDSDEVIVTVSDLSSDLVAYWPLNESEGFAADLINDQDAIPSGAGISYMPAGGKVGGAFLMDGGPSTRLLAPSINVPGNEMTITFWMKADNLSSVEGRLISKADGSSEQNHYWMVSLNGGSQLRFRLKTDQGGTETMISSAGQVQAGDWYFITAIYDGENMKLLKNKLEIVSTAKQGSLSQADVPVAIGNQPPGAGERPFPGLMDDVRIYKKALSSAEIEEVYNAACANYVLSENRTFVTDTTISSGNEIELRNVSVGEGATLTLKSLKATLGENVVLSNSAGLRIINESGCE